MALLAFVVVVAIWLPWKSIWGPDNRTYAEMIDGVRRYGLPYTLNGDFSRYPEVSAPFNVPNGARLWGQYPPLFAYLAAPAAALGGLMFVFKFNVLLIGAVAIATFALARRVARDGLAAAAASVLVVLGAPLWIASVETLAQPLFVLVVTLASLAAVRSIETRVFRRTLVRAALCGLAGGLAVATHLLGFPMMLMLMGGLLIADLRPAPRARAGALGFLRATAPTQLGWLRLAAALVPFAAVLALLGLLNRMRFGTMNPLSYGPCIWRLCEGLIAKEGFGAGDLLTFARPALPWFGVVAIGVFFSLRNPRALALILGLAALALAPPSLMSERVRQILEISYGFTVDLSGVDIGYVRPADGFGNAQWGRTLKSLLQHSPVLALALAGGVSRDGAAARRFIVLLPAVALYGYLGLFARFPGGDKFGTPFLFLRYALPAVPLLAVLAVHSLRELPWRRSAIALGVVVAVGTVVLFASSLDDSPFWRRYVELRVTLAFAAIAVLLTLAARSRGGARLARAATLASAIAAGLSVGVTLGVDTTILGFITHDVDRRIRRIGDQTPDRFAIVGWEPDLTNVLSLRVGRDVRYVDLVEANGWENFRKLIDEWNDEQRPIFAVFPRDSGRFKWPYAAWDVPAELIDEQEGLWRIGPPKRRFDGPVPPLPAPNP